MTRAVTASKAAGKAAKVAAKVTAKTPRKTAAGGTLPAAENTHAALDRHVGALIREARVADRLTVTDVAHLAGISVGMLSKMENGQVSPSLDSLNRIAKALGVPVGHFFRNFGTPAASALLVKKGEGMEVVRRGTAKGHTYHLLAYDQGPNKRFEPFLISMDDESEVFPTFEHPGTEFIYMLEGRIEYRHGDQTYLLAPGDALSFRGDVPHGPEKLLKLPIRFLAIIYYGDA